MKKVGNFIYWLVLAILLGIAGLTVVSTLNIPGNYKLLVVQSGSMEPAIRTGSIVVVRPADKYQKGDVITFADLKQPKETTTHRIFEVKDASGSALFITKGDANKAPDMGEVSLSRVTGKVLTAIPFVGYPVNFAKTPTGLIILVIIPAVIIIYSELLNIKNEILRLIKEKHEKEVS